jgi:hypothetical protein
MTEHPKRTQLSRAKGWKMPPNTVKVDRSTKWGNPYKEGVTPGNYASWFKADLIKEMKSENAPTEPDHPFSVHLWNICQNIGQLRGKNLACWCRCENLCHADVLLELANSPDLGEALGKLGEDV